MYSKKEIPTVPLIRFLKHSLEILKNPLPFHRQNFNEKGDIFRLKIGFKNEVFFTRDTAFAQYVLQKNQKNFVKSKIQTVDLVKYVGEGLLTSEGEKWKRQRKMMQPAFHKKQLENLLFRMQDTIVSEFKNIEANKTIDLFPILNDLAFQTVVKSLFTKAAKGNDMERLQLITEANQKMLVKELRQPYLGWWFKLSGTLNKHLNFSIEARTILKGIVDERRASSKQYGDLLDMLLDSGGLDVEISAEKFQKDFTKHITNFKGNKSLFQYLQEYYFSLVDVDPNGLIMLEYLKQEKIFPAYKSTGDIRNYESDGQKLEWVIYEPIKKVVNDVTLHIWRVVDDNKDWVIIQDGTSFTLDPTKTFEHPFGEVPAVILSSVNKLGSETRYSPVFPIEELAKDYARDKSVITIYKFIHGFTKEWRYRQICQTCRGVEKTGEKKCGDCGGSGWMGKNDVTDIQNVEIPRDSDSPIITPPAGFIEPDTKTWTQYNEDMVAMEQKMHNTAWGTDRVKSTERNKETATGRYIDVQPVMNKLDKQSTNVQWIDNTLGNWVLRWTVNDAKTKDTYHRSYGRGFIIESPEALLTRYEKARTEESSFTVLNRLLGEYLLSKYRNNPMILEEMKKEAQVEPYLHMSMSMVNTIFGRNEALRKQMFGDFWEVADRTKEVDILRKEFDTYFEQNKGTFETAEPEPIIPAS